MMNHKSLTHSVSYLCRYRAALAAKNGVFGVFALNKVKNLPNRAENGLNCFFLQKIFLQRWGLSYIRKLHYFFRGLLLVRIESVKKLNFGKLVVF